MKFENSSKYVKEPVLSKDDELTLIISAHGSTKTISIIYYNDVAYYIKPSEVFEARRIINMEPKEEIIEYLKDMDECGAKPELSHGDRFTTILAKYGWYGGRHTFYYDGVKYLITKDIVQRAKEIHYEVNMHNALFEVNNRIPPKEKYDPISLPELSPNDELTKFVADKGNKYHTVLLKFNETWYKVSPSETEWAKSAIASIKSVPVNRKWRDAIMERDNHTCQHCGSHENLQGHHILGRASHPEMANDIDNGIVLCAECHKRFHQLYGYTGFTQTDLIKFMKFD